MRFPKKLSKPEERLPLYLAISYACFPDPRRLFFSLSFSAALNLHSTEFRGQLFLEGYNTHMREAPPRLATHLTQGASTSRMNRAPRTVFSQAAHDPPMKIRILSIALLLFLPLYAAAQTADEIVKK